LPLPQSTKRRALHAEGPDSYFRNSVQVGTGPVSTSVSVTKWAGSSAQKLWQGVQETASEQHPGWRKNTSAGDVGGNFTTTRKLLETGLVSQDLSARQVSSPIVNNRQYAGIFAAISPAQTAFPSISPSSDAELNKAGATAVAKCKPTNSVANLSVALGELYRERLPSVTRWDQIRRDTDRARRVGDEYLKSEFGWMPLLGELRNFGSAVTRSGEILSQYERDAGKLVRRRFRFPTEKSTTVVELGADGVPYMATDPAQFLIQGKTFQGRVVRTTQIVRRRWFSGAFRYSLPVGYYSHDAVTRHAARASVLFGAELTPSTVWNLAPWSWAVDWFTNVGDVISNASDYAFDGLVMKYGYIMEHSLIRVTYTYRGLHNMQTSAVPQPVSLLSEVKVRRQANPFGFGVTWEGLTPRQIAITIALGLTR